jgi:ribosomal-protein-alanine acetyltransferase
VIRRATSEDVAWIAALEVDGAYDPWTDAMVADSLAAGARGWVGEGDGVVAHLLVQVAGPVADVLTVVTRPDARRRGWGRRLLDVALAELDADGVVEVFLEVRDSNAPARALYRATGFDEVGARRRYYADGEDAIVMRRGRA